MSTAPVTRAQVGPPGPGARRVRHQARDVLVLMSFSLGMSLLFATAFLLLAGLGR